MAMNYRKSIYMRDEESFAIHCDILPEGVIILGGESTANSMYLDYYERGDIPEFDKYLDLEDKADPHKITLI